MNLGYWLDRSTHWFSISIDPYPEYPQGTKLSILSPLYPSAVFTIIHRSTQSTSPSRSMCPNHLNHKADWLQSQQFSKFRIFLPFFQCKPTKSSDHTHFTSIQLYFMLQLHWPNLTDIIQTTSYTTLYTLTLNFNENPFRVNMGK